MEESTEESEEAMSCENGEKLQAELYAVEWDISPAMAQASIDRLSAEVDRLRELLREIAGCVPTMDAPLDGYLEIQIDRPTWDKLQEEVEP